ncbi:MAG: class I SAM-dependent methyltransferase [Rhodospirillales bacterium]|nr:class I SAM-dependent methyltransferase [Rhodospirillales bacterium]
MPNDPLKEARSVAPHPPLLRYYGEDYAREAFVQNLFDRTAGAYDGINSWASFGLGNWYRRRTLQTAGIKAGMRVLDVAIGTGLVARQAARLVGPHGSVVGIDISFKMLLRARAMIDAPLLQGRAEQLPVRTTSVDAITMGYALRHVADLSDTFAEFYRVLRPGGRLLLLEIVRPKGRRGYALAEIYLRRIVPMLAGITTRVDETRTLMRYFWDTIEHCVPAGAITQALRDAGFADVRNINEFGVFVAYLGHKP